MSAPTSFLRAISSAFVPVAKRDNALKRQALSASPLELAQKFPARDHGASEALGSPFIPEHLSDDARGCIDIIKQSIPSNVYSTLDSFLLSAFAMAWATHKRAAHEIGAPGFQWMTGEQTGRPAGESMDQNREPAGRNIGGAR